MKNSVSKICGIIVVVSCLTLEAFAQPNYKQLVDEVSVTNLGGLLKYPWVGGLNSPQFNTLDLNGDGVNDLVLFDRFANKIYCFLVLDGTYQYAPSYEHAFPKDLKNWFFLRDFNGDGKKDIFTSHPFGIAVFVNTTTSIEAGLTWRPYNNGIALQTVGFSGVIDLNVNVSDIPSISDLDGDGDLDILTARFSGNSTIEFHQNQSVELNNNTDSLMMIRVTQRWANIEDCGCGKFELGGLPCFGGRIQHNGGKALLAFDVDHDGDQDMLYSDEFCSTISWLKNDGSDLVPLFNNAGPFLNLTAPIFLAPFMEDVDGDGLEDFIAASNFSARSLLESDFSSSVMRYSGTPLNEFNFQQSDFLQQNMIDVGDNAAPAFADFDGDGDEDMFVGCYVGKNQTGVIALYENTGSFLSPAFELLTHDYLSLSAQHLVSIVPQFVDINRDGRKDIVFSASDAATGLPGIYYYENQSSSAFIFSGNSKTISFGLVWDEKVAFTDFNQDGHIDIIKGTYFGAIQLWLNNGSLQFTLSDKLDYLGYGLDRLSPHLTIADLDNDGRDDLLIGDHVGYLKVVLNYRSGENEPTDISIWNMTTETYEPMKLGGRLFPTVVNLFSTDASQIIVGTSGGGLVFLQPEGDVNPNKIAFHIYPNPVSRQEELTIVTNSSGVMSVTDMMGQMVSSTVNLEVAETYKFDISALPAGVYIIRLSVLGEVVSKRIIVYGN